MLWNTPKSQFRSNGVEWMFYNFGAPKYAFRPETQVLHLFTCRRLAKCSETHPNMILGTMESNGCFTTSVPKMCIQAHNTSFASFTCRRLAKCSEKLPNIILGLMESNGCFTTSVPWNSAFRPETQVLHLLRAEVSEMLWNTPKHRFESNGVEWMLYNFGTPK
jgi:hypothetical protein